MFKHFRQAQKWLLHVVLWCGIGWTFWHGIVGLWQTYSSFWLLENAIAAGVVAVGFAGVTWQWGRKSHVFEEQELSTEQLFTYWAILLLLFFSCVGLLLNNFLGGFQILPPILTYVVVYAVLGFYLKPAFWRRSIFVLILFILTLPVLERLQKFIGFPLRLVTAKIVSVMLQFIGAGHVSRSTIIMTENHATSIDLPCSGVKSLYFGGIVLLCVYFLQQVRLTLKAVVLAAFFFFLLFFFNVWRVFGLVYVYAVLMFKEAGDSIHVALGIIGFAVSCAALWYLSEKWLEKLSLEKKNVKKQKKVYEVWLKKLPALTQKKLLLISLLLISVTGILTRTFLVLPPPARPALTETAVTISVPKSELVLQPFSSKEQTLFWHPEVTFAAKYLFNWQEHKNLNLLLVRSTSARTHHDPELCLQGLGYQLLKDEEVSLGEESIKSLTIQTADNPTAPQAFVYYWYVSADDAITDYSERVWSQFQQPSQEWVLIEVSGYMNEQPTKDELKQLFNDLNAEVRNQLLSGTK